MTEATGVRDDSSVREDRVTNPKVLVENQQNNAGGGGAVPAVSKSTQVNRAAARWAILRSAIIESSQKQVHQTCDQQKKPEATPIPQPAVAATDRHGHASEGSIHRFAGFGLLQRQRIPRHKVAPLKDRLTTITLARDDQKESLIEALECSLLALSALRPDNWIWQFAVKCLSGELSSSLCEEIQGNENLKLMLGKVEERLQQHQSNPKQRLRLKVDQCCWEEPSKNSSTASNTKTLKITLAPFYPSHGMFQYTLPSFSSNEEHTGANGSSNDRDDDQLRDFLFIRERLNTTTKKTLKELTTHHHNKGVDNTGNVCVWDSEQTLAYTLREHAALGKLPWWQDCQKEKETDLSILELGCGMAGLAGLSILQSLVDQPLQRAVIENAKIRLWMTDGHPQAVQNNRVHAYLWRQLHGSSPDPGDPILCRVLPWSIEPPTISLPLPQQQQIDTIPPCNVALVSDCTHFQEFHAHLFFTLAFHVRVNGCIYMCQPHRGNSLERFLDVVRSTMVLGAEDKDNNTNADDENRPLFSIEWLDNVSAAKESIASSASSPHYDPNIHCPRIILLRKLREVAEQDRRLVAEHMKIRDVDEA